MRSYEVLDEYRVARSSDWDVTVKVKEMIRYMLCVGGRSYLWGTECPHLWECSGILRKKTFLVQGLK